MKEQLKKIGLSDKESAVYLAALELGETSVGRLASRSKIKRTTVYLALALLQEKGLISKVKRNKKTLFLAEDPRLLETLLDSKKEILNGLMPELLSFNNLLDKKPGVKYFEGEEGIKNIFEEGMKYPNEELKVMFSDNYSANFGDDFFQRYTDVRIKKRISTRTLISDSSKMKLYSAQDLKSLRRSRVLPSTAYSPSIEIIIFHNFKVALISFKERFGLLIESELINRSFKSYFETLWLFGTEPNKISDTEIRNK